MQVVTILVMLTITIALLTAGACASSTDERPPADEVAAAPPEPAATPEPMPTAEPTATPKPVESVTAQELYDAREANATRFDDQYKGKTVRVSGQVVKIEGGDVTLGIDLGYGIDTYGFVGVQLRDLSKDDQISLDKGQQISAVCEVGNYIIGTMMMKKCKLDAPADEVATAPPEPAATPEPMPTAEPTAPPTPEPELSLDPGTYKVGTDIQPGIYAGRAGIDILNSCNWQRLSGAGGTLEEVIAIEIVQGQFYVEVHPTDEYLNVSCEITPLADWPAPDELPTKIEPGTHIVGRDIAPGTYAGKAGADILDSCNWQRLSRVSGELSDVIAIEIAQNSYYVTIDATDYAFNTSCELTLSE